MKWILNDTITEDKTQEIISYIDKDLLINRICYSLNIDNKDLFKFITEDEIGLLVSDVLINRGIDTKEQINSLVNNISSCILSPYELHNAKKAADVITEYCNTKNSFIYTYADYDCDGVQSGYISTSVLKPLSKGFVSVKYPNRNEGYGLNMDWCDMIIERHTNESTGKVDDKVLIITVDNGITKYKEVAKLKANGIECVVTDHHPSKEGEVPNCIIVNPHNSSEEQDDKYKHLCGCGVIFKVMEIVQNNFGINTMLQYTPNVALATLSDVMPLNEENLAFVQYGLEIMNGSNCPKGIKALMELKEIDVMTTNDILWTVAPMINACGRMGNTELASMLFFLDDFSTPNEIVVKINQVNENRKSITKKAKATLSKLNFDADKVCIVVTDEYPGGILGIIAGEMTKLFNKPSIVVTKDNKGLCHGSIRSANKINMITLLKELMDKKLLVDYGGHSEACACTFELSNLDKIKEYFNNAIQDLNEIDDILSREEPTLSIDEIITLEHLNDVVYTIVNMFPCDNRNYKNPTFALTNLNVVSYSISQNNPDNIKFNIKQNGRTKSIWAWGFADKYINELGCPKAINIAGNINKSFLDKRYTLNVVDIMAS